MLSYNKQGKSSLLLACENGKIDFVHYILSSCQKENIEKDKNQYSYSTPLMTAINARQKDVVQLLLSSNKVKKSII